MALSDEPTGNLPILDDYLTPECTLTEKGERLAMIFEMLGEETRFKLFLKLLGTNEMHVGDLCEHVDKEQPAVSHHLALMRPSKIVESRRDGNNVYYHVIENTARELLAFLSMFQSQNGEGDCA